jgi:hypothetical protein
MGLEGEAMSGSDAYKEPLPWEPLTFRGRVKLAIRTFISPEEALRRTPEAEEDDTPDLEIVKDLDWTLAMREAERLENEGGAWQTALATNWRVRALCREWEREKKRREGG